MQRSWGGGQGWSVLGAVKRSVRLDFGELGESNMSKKNIEEMQKKKTRKSF